MPSLRDLCFLLSHAARAHAARGCPSFPLLPMTPLTLYTAALALRHVHTAPHLNSQVHFSTSPFHAHASSAPQLVGTLFNNPPTGTQAPPRRPHPHRPRRHRRRRRRRHLGQGAVPYIPRAPAPAPSQRPGTGSAAGPHPARPSGNLPPPPGKPGRTYAAAPPPAKEWTMRTVQKKKAVRVKKETTSPQMELRRFALVRDHGVPNPTSDATAIQSVVNVE